MNLMQLIIYLVLGIAVLLIYLLVKKKTLGSIRGDLPQVPKNHFLRKKIMMKLKNKTKGEK